MVKGQAFFLLLILFSNILITGSLYPLIYIAAAFLHECGHLLAIYAYGHGVADIKFVGIGIRIKSGNVFSYRQEVVIGALGPITNLVVGGACILISLIARNELLDYFILSNIIYACINLVPIAPLDGNRILSNALHLHFSYHSASAILRVITSILTILLILFFIIFCWRGNLNLSFLLLLTTLIGSAVFQLLGN